MGFYEDENEEESGLLHGTERCNSLFEAVLAKFPGRQGDAYQVALDSRQRFQAWIPSLLECLPHMVGDRGVFIRQVVKSVEANLHSILEIESCKTKQGAEQRAMGELAKDMLSVISNSINQLENYTTVVSRKLAEKDIYDQHRAVPGTYDSLIIRGLILSRFPKLSESILRLLERSVVARREILLSLRNGRLAQSWESEADEEDQESSDTEPLSSAQPLSWNDRRYLDPPESDGDAKTKRCSWCHDDLEVSKLRDIVWWRKHFLRDLQPYVCLAGCEHPRMLFSRFHEWQDHMDFFHNVDWIEKLQVLDEWHCDITSCPSKEKRFGTSNELQSHFHLVHGREVSLAQIALMPKKGVEPPTGELASCPLCHQHVMTEGFVEGIIADGINEQSVYSKTPQGLGGPVADESTEMPMPIPLEDPTSQELETRETLIRHIANDIKGLAFLSLEGIEAETLRGGPSDSLEHQRNPDRILREDNDSEISLSVRTSGSLKPDLGTPSSRRVSIGAENSGGVKESSIWDNTDYVYWSGFPDFRLPTRRHRGNGHDRDIPAVVGDSQVTRSFLADGQLKKQDEISVSTVATSSHLRDEINDALVESAFDSGRRFFPEGNLDRLVTSENIWGALTYRGFGNEQIQALADFVLTAAKKLFAIIVDTDMIDVGDALESFRKSGVTDRHLPIPRELINCGRIKDQSIGKICHHDAALNMFHEKPWRRPAISAFYHSQWQFLAPLFTPDNNDMTLDVRAILPLVRVGRDARMGFFSEVYEVDLHRDHHRGIVPSEDGHELRVALKELRMDSRDDEIRRVFERETRSLKELRDFRNKHMITAIASIIRGERRYFIFPWADGEDLRAFWMTKEFWPLTPHLIRETVQQLSGLANALYILHQGGWRHGDVKPENILIFKNQTTLGTLKLGDLGLAKTHHADTALRRAPTETRVGTMRYEPPETVTSNNQPRSRRYDIWSMGCVVMEFVIWLLYGPTGLNEFSRALSNDNTIGEAFYSTRQGDGRELQAEVHPIVRFWLDEISQNSDWPRDSVIADLVRLVATKLLVVRTSLARLPSPMVEQLSLRPSIVPSVTIGMDLEPDISDVRADAKILQEQLELILGKCLADPEYLFPRAARAALYRRVMPGHNTPRAGHLAHRHTDALKPSALQVEAYPKRLSLLSLAREAEEYNDRQESNLQDHWEYITDNTFASQFFQSFGGDIPATPWSSVDQICDYCADIDFCAPKFSVVYPTKYLEESAICCHLCSLLHSALPRSGLNQPDSPTIQLKRYDSMIKLQTGGPPILSIVADSGNLIASPTAPLIPADIQIGLPNLHNFNSTASRHILRQWLANCDAGHQCIFRNKSNQYFPTRILLIENNGAPTVRLIETVEMVDKSQPYITLSYVWGSYSPGWRLENSNYARFQHGMPASELPPSFRDAALVAIQIGIPYLWIDALCVVHDSRFDTEADIMDRDLAFQGSHCTISLSSAVSIGDGFLKPRRHRRAVKMRRENGGVYYVCELIDDFNRDVEESPLSSRGWAFQERVLSRRTIFFTDTQTYWQCGDDIRCETLTKLRNWRSRILGDPDFPMLSLEALRPVQTYQQFYERYSLLRFSFSVDRFRAIQPLEKRILQALRSEGGYGVVARFLGRSLLWRRGPGQTLERIKFPEDKHIPSWSWQAYIGGITYLYMPPDAVAWNRIHCWFGNRDFDGTSEDIGELEAEAWDFDFQALSANISNNLTVVWDWGEHGRREDLKCITVGSSKVRSDEIGPPRANYLLIVAPGGDYKRFERLGVGYMDGEEDISKDKVVIRVR